jgi:hypothetical protein
MTGQLKTPRKGLMNTTASFSLVMKPRFNRPKRKKSIRLKVMLASFATAPDNLYGASSKLCFASGNVEPAHNTTKYFVPTYDEVVNLTGLLETKGMSVLSGKQ